MASFRWEWFWNHPLETITSKYLCFRCQLVTRIMFLRWFLKFFSQVWVTKISATNLFERLTTPRFQASNHFPQGLTETFLSKKAPRVPQAYWQADYRRETKDWSCKPAMVATIGVDSASWLLFVSAQGKLKTVFKKKTTSKSFGAEMLVSQHLSG